MENSNLTPVVSDKKGFNFGVAVGIAAISSVFLAGLLIYVFSGGRAACMAGDGDSTTTVTKGAKKFETCLTSGKYDSAISADQNLGAQLGVQGTPASFINGYYVSGALPIEMIRQVIDKVAAGQEPDFEFMQDESTGKIVKVEMPQITDKDHVTGAKNGKITIVEFSDFECPYCGRYKTTIDAVLKEYSDVTLVFKHFPLSFHQNAKPAAIATECANEQGKFWEMYDKLFALNNAGTVTLDNIKKAAVEIGLK